MAEIEQFVFDLTGRMTREQADALMDLIRVFAIENACDIGGGFSPDEEEGQDEKGA